MSMRTARLSPFFLGPRETRLQMVQRRAENAIALPVDAEWNIRDSTIVTFALDTTLLPLRPGSTTVIAKVEGIVDSAIVRVAREIDTTVTVIAHRGFASVAPENTLEAFENAFDLGASIIETDVFLTKDGVPVLMHDPTVDRTTNGVGPITALSYDYVSTLNACPNAAPRWTMCHVPTLRDALALIKRRRGRVQLETKGPWINSALEVLVAEIATAHMTNRVMFTSFERGNLSLLRSRSERIQLGLLSWTRVDLDELAALHINAVLLNSAALDGTETSVAYVRSARERGIDVGVWTINGLTGAYSALKNGNVRLVSDAPLASFR